MTNEQQFDFYWNKIFDGLSWSPIEFATYRFDESISLPEKLNKLYEMFKVLATNNQEVMDYLKEFVETFDTNLTTTIDDVFQTWLSNGTFGTLIKPFLTNQPSGVVQNEAVLKATYPNGANGIYITSEDGNWWFYTGSSWEKGGKYQSTIQDLNDVRNVVENSELRDTTNVLYINTKNRTVIPTVTKIDGMNTVSNSSGSGIGYRVSVDKFPFVGYYPLMIDGTILSDIKQSIGVYLNLYDNNQVKIQTITLDTLPLPEKRFVDVHYTTPSLNLNSDTRNIKYIEVEFVSALEKQLNLTALSIKADYSKRTNDYSIAFPFSHLDGATNNYINTHDTSTLTKTTKIDNKYFATATSGQGIGYRVNTGIHYYLRYYNQQFSGLVMVSGSVPIELVFYLNGYNVNGEKIKTVELERQTVQPLKESKFSIFVPQYGVSMADVSANVVALEYEVYCTVSGIDLHVTDFNLAKIPDTIFNRFNARKNLFENANLEKLNDMKYINTHATNVIPSLIKIDNRYWASSTVGDAIGYQLTIRQSYFLAYYRSLFTGRFMLSADGEARFYINFYDSSNTKIKTVLLETVKRLTKSIDYSFSFEIAKLTDYMPDYSNVAKVEYELYFTGGGCAIDWELTKISRKSSSDFSNDGNITVNPYIENGDTNGYVNTHNKGVPVKLVTIDDQYFAQKTSDVGIGQYIPFSKLGFLQYYSSTIKGSFLVNALNTGANTVVLYMNFYDETNTKTRTVTLKSFTGLTSMYIYDFEVLIPQFRDILTDGTVPTYVEFELVTNTDNELNVRGLIVKANKVTLTNEARNTSNVLTNSNLINGSLRGYLNTHDKGVALKLATIDGMFFAQKTSGYGVGQYILISDIDYMKNYTSTISGKFLVNRTADTTLPTVVIYVNIYDSTNTKVKTNEIKRYTNLNNKMIYDFEVALPKLSSLIGESVDPAYVEIEVWALPTDELNIRELEWNVEYGKLVVEKTIIESDTQTKLAQLYINGTLPSTKDEKTTHSGVLLKDGIRMECNFSLKWQGSSSLSESNPKKNLRIVFLENDLSTKKKVVLDKYFVSNDSFNLKGYFSDPTYSLDYVSGKIFRSMVATRKSVPDKLLLGQNMLTPTGFPIELYVNNTYHGLFFFTNRKDKQYYNLSKSDLGFAIEGQNASNNALFQVDSDTLDGTNFEIQESNLSDEETIAKWNDLMKFVNSSTDEEFKANVSSRIDIESVIDYALIVQALTVTDNTGRNTQYVTYDGTKFFATVYDFNQALGNSWNGENLNKARLSYNYLPFVDPEWAKKENKFFSRIMTLYKEQAKERYAVLRQTSLSFDFISRTLDENLERIGEMNRLKDNQKWNLNAFNSFTPTVFLRNLAKRLVISDEQVKNW